MPEPSASWDEEIRDQIHTSIAVKRSLAADGEMIAAIHNLARKCVSSLRAGGKVIFAGNGGSFADAQHLSAEFTSRFAFDRAPLPSLALGTNSSAMSAIGNDYGYEQVFARELRSIAKPEDVFVPISTSGNSSNLLAAAETARSMSLPTVGLTGKTGGKLLKYCECVRVPSTETARIQECHIMVGHIVCALVENALFRS